MEKDFPFYPSIPGTTELSGRQFYAVEASGQMRRFSCTGKTLLWTAPEQEPLALSGQTLKIGDEVFLFLPEALSDIGAAILCLEGNRADVWIFYRDERDVLQLRKRACSPLPSQGAPIKITLRGMKTSFAFVLSDHRIIPAGTAEPSLLENTDDAFWAEGPDGFMLAMAGKGEHFFFTAVPPADSQGKLAHGLLHGQIFSTPGFYTAARPLQTKTPDVSKPLPEPLPPSLPWYRRVLGHLRRIPLIGYFFRKAGD